MTDQLAAADHPAEPADLFVRLYDSIADGVFHDWTATQWYSDEQVRRRAGEIAETVLDDGVLAPATTAEIIAADGDRGRFTIMLGLDIALAHVNPYAPYHNAPALAPVLVHYLTEGKLNGEGTTGALLPAARSPDGRAGCPSRRSSSASTASRRTSGTGSTTVSSPR